MYKIYLLPFLPFVFLSVEYILFYYVLVEHVFFLFFRLDLMMSLLYHVIYIYTLFTIMQQLSLLDHSLLVHEMI
jgi:hypothetical protein